MLFDKSKTCCSAFLLKKIVLLQLRKNFNKKVFINVQTIINFRR